MSYPYSFNSGLSITTASGFFGSFFFFGSSGGGFANLIASFITASMSIISRPYFKFRYLAEVFLPLNLPPMMDIFKGSK